MSGPPPGVGAGGGFSGEGFRQQYPNYDAPFNPNPADNEAPIVIYGYVPSLGLAITACVVYGVLLLVHLAYFCLKRARGTRCFQGLLWFGALLEVGGYVVRSLSNANPFVVNYFVVQYFLIVVAPVFISAAFYLALSDGLNRLPQDTKRALIPFKTKIFVIIFIILDVVTTIVQIAGAALVGVAESSNVRNDGDGPNITSQDANRILMAGLAVQVVSFLAFLSLLAFALYKSRKLAVRPFSRTFELVLSITSFLVFLRTVYRLAETAEGVFGYAFTSEILFGCLDFAPVALSLIIWAAFPLFKLIPPISPHSLAAQKHSSGGASGDEDLLHQPRSSPTLSPATETRQYKMGKEQSMV
ncbi:hypothetical protein ACM66B_005449 [Microbotryomycetes sp. NB124-2]